MTVSYWICALVSLISATVSLGYAIAGARDAAGSNRTASLYALSRSLALFVVAAVALFTGSIGFVAAVALAMVLVQGMDAFVGSTLDDRVKTWGPAATAAANLAVLAWLLLS